MFTAAAGAQGVPHPTISTEQRDFAKQIEQAGVPISELNAQAPTEYTVRRGDTLWDVARQFLHSPWHWPALWGMNLKEIKNPHLIYPGQRLVLDRSGDRAQLRWANDAHRETQPTVRVSPRHRSTTLGGGPLPMLQPHLIEPFLAEPLVVDNDTFDRAPRIVATNSERRVLLATGDRAYARGPHDAPLILAPGLPTRYRVFRQAVPLKDPASGEVLAYEGQFVGRAELIRGESEVEEPLVLSSVSSSHAHAAPAAGNQDAATLPGVATEPRRIPVPATMKVLSAKEEMRPGDRLVPEPARDFRNYAPRAPEGPIKARVMSIHGGSAVRYAAQNQVVVINKGLRDGIETGHVLALISTGKELLDKTESKQGERVQLPDERNGLALVFRPFERVSYALVMEIAEPVQIGDRLMNPR